MIKKISGTGSTLAVLIFSVLCLTIFSLISLSAAKANEALAMSAANTVKGYYEADLRAEFIVAEIINAEKPPENIGGIEVFSDGGKASFICPISDNKELYVEIDMHSEPFNIIEWRMRDVEEWEKDSGLPVWSGD